MPKNDPIYQRCYMRLLRSHGYVDSGLLRKCIEKERLGRVESPEDKPQKPIIIYKKIDPNEKPLYRPIGVFTDKPEPETTLEKESRVSRTVRQSEGLPLKKILEMLEDENDE